MAYKNNHYVPQLILRRYGENISTYDLKSREYKTNQTTAEIFSEYEFYPVEIELEFGQIESRFANILNNKILTVAPGEKVELSRKELYIVKKFLLLEQMRVEMVLCTTSATFSDMLRVMNEDLGIKYPFKELVIENETVRERWLRNIRVIIECENLEKISEHRLCTNEVYRWAQIYLYGYIAIWDSSFDGTDFVITDVGMTSELEESYKYYRLEFEKKEYLLKAMQTTTVPSLQSLYSSLFMQQCNFHENFYMFSVSKNRMIVLINPFFRLYSRKEKTPIPSIWPTHIEDRRLFEKNDATIPMILGNRVIYRDTDIFKYKIQSMKHKDIILVNCLMLDRIDRMLGFVSSDNLAESVQAYMDWYKRRNAVPRNDYSELLKFLGK